MNTLNETLAARGNRYGEFDGHAKVTQDLKFVIADALASRNKELADDQQEALDMIVHKIGRIINGDANYDDSWVDIAGYAQLVADRLRRDQAKEQAVKETADVGVRDIFTEFVMQTCGCPRCTERRRAEADLQQQAAAHRDNMQAQAHVEAYRKAARK